MPGSRLLRAWIALVMLVAVSLAPLTATASVALAPTYDQFSMMGSRGGW